MSWRRAPTPINKRLWARVRRQVFKRDGYRCRTCGRAGRLECDHVVPLHVDPDQDPYDPGGCQTLCRGCHRRKTGSENRHQPAPDQQAWIEHLRGLTATR